MLNAVKTWWHYKKLIAFYKPFITPGDICFDIGANVGKKTKVFVALGAQVIAVEPQAACCTQLKARYKSPPVQVVNKGVAAHQAVLDFNIAELDEITSASKAFVQYYTAKYNHHYKGIIPVECTTLQMLIKQYGLPAFCKIDVEGMEWEVLQGLEQPIKTIEFEFTAPFISNAINCVARLQELAAYKYNYIAYEHPVLQLPAFQTAEQFTGTLQQLPAGLLHGNVIACKV